MKNYRKGVFVVIYSINDKNQISYLVLKRKKHWVGWEFPKGGIDRFEFKKSGAKREVKEETGYPPIKLKSHPIKGKYKYDHEFKDRPGFIGQSYKLYSSQIKSKDIKLDKREHTDYKWLDFDSAFKILTWPNQKMCLNYVNKYLTK